MHGKRAVTYIRLQQCTCCNHHDHHRHHKQKHESKRAKHARSCGLKRGCGIHDPQHGVRAIQESRRSCTHINTRTCALTLQSFITHHIIHQWSHNWILDIKIAQKRRKSSPKSNQQRPNGTKHSCSHYCCYWRYCDKHDFMILVTIIAGKLKNVVQAHNKCKQARNVQENTRKYDFAKKRGGVIDKRRIWTEILFE